MAAAGRLVHNLRRMERMSQLTRPVTGAGSGLLLVGAATVVLLPFRARLPTASPAVLLIVPVVIAGMLAGRSGALITAGGGGAALSFAFIPRVGALRIAGTEDAAAWIAFAALAGIVGTVAAWEATNRRSTRDRARPAHTMAAAGSPSAGPAPLTRRALAYARTTRDKLTPQARRAWRRSDVAFIETVYQGVLDRPPDAAGLHHHLDELSRDVPRTNILRKIVESPESSR